MISWMATARRTLSSVGGQRLVVGVRVQAVAVVEQRIERLERGADIVEGDLLRVQAPPRSLHVILEHLTARSGLIALAHGACPDATRHAPDDRVLRIHAVGEEEGQVGREVIDGHAARQVVLDDGEAVGERESQL